MLENNPLRQFFRRPALYLKLPSGGNHYPAGTLELPENGEIPIYPMTAIDEITSKTPDSLYNGVAVVEIIKSCAPNIKDPWHLPIVDLDAILVSIRAASSNDGLEINTICPSCSEGNDYKVNVSAVLSTIKSGNYDEVLNLGDLKIKFKPLNYKEVNDLNLNQSELQKMLLNNTNIEDEDQKLKISGDIINRLNVLTFDIVSKCIEYIDCPTGQVTNKNHIIEFLQNCGKNTFEDIKMTGIKLREPSETKPLKIKCPSCSHEYEQIFTLNITDFFE